MNNYCNNMITSFAPNLHINNRSVGLSGGRAVGRSGGRAVGRSGGRAVGRSGGRAVGRSKFDLRFTSINRQLLCVVLC